MTYLVQNVLLFGRTLRQAGLPVDTRRLTEIPLALEMIDLQAREEVYHTFRSLLVQRARDIPLFDTAFDLFWRLAPLPTLVEKKRDSQNRLTTVQPDDPFVPPPAAQSPKPDEEPVALEVKTYSPTQVLRHKDFSELTREEIQEIHHLINEMDWTFGERRTRRFRPGAGTCLDLRQVLRQSLKHQGEFLQWPRRIRKVNSRPLVVLADVSGSMERYARVLLQMIYALSRITGAHTEAFVFSTQLTRITQQLHNQNIPQALAAISKEVEDWSGGTRIGEALKNFNFEWGRRVLGHGAVTLLISDGWDRGDAGMMQREMARLQRLSYRLIWLNPLLGQPAYQPLTRGMQIALPFIDDFLPAHNLASLEDLARYLTQLKPAA